MQRWQRLLQNEFQIICLPISEKKEKKRNTAFVQDRCVFSFFFQKPETSERIILNPYLQCLLSFQEDCSTKSTGEQNKKKKRERARCYHIRIVISGLWLKTVLLLFRVNVRLRRCLIPSGLENNFTLGAWCMSLSGMSHCSLSFVQRTPKAFCSVLFCENLPESTRSNHTDSAGDWNSNHWDAN